MRAVVLVGGFGTRLRPLTYSIPKPMLPVVHRPIIEHLVVNLVRAGITDVVLALGFKPEPFMEAFPDGTCAGATLTYAVEPEPLDTAGAIAFAARHAGIDDTFVVANGDVLTDLDLSRLVSFHRERGAMATIHAFPVEDPSAFGVVELDDEQRVLRFVEKPAPGTAPSNLINAGTYVLEPSVLDLIPSGRKVSIERETFPVVSERGGLFAMAADAYWLDTGRPELYLQANLDVLSGRSSVDCPPPISSAASVAASATLSDCVLADDVQIEADVVVERSVLLDGARIGAGSVVRDSIVLGIVPAGCTLDEVVLGVDGRLEPGAEVRAERIPSPE
ncbi:MAG: NDP-sugar synthase [Ilumatobacteraceae bacterium]